MLTNTAGDLIAENDVWTGTEGGKLLQYKMTLNNAHKEHPGACVPFRRRDHRLGSKLGPSE